MVEQVIKEFGSMQTVSGQFKDRVDQDVFKNLLIDQIIRDATYQGYSPVAEPEFFWDEQAFTYVDDEEGGVRKVLCDPTDEKALFNVACKVKVVQNAIL